MAEQAENVAPKAKIFISYSRKDMAFADRLEAALKARGFEPLLDRAEIYAFEDWWQRIEAVIRRADTVVFVISPDAVESKVTLKEVAHAASLNKRVAPIVARRTDDAAIPEAVRRLNFIFFDDPVRFEASAEQLAEALRTDIGWIRQHTEYGEAAHHWAASGRPGGLELRSPALEEAERWIASRPRGAPEPTAETQAFVTESRRGATRRRNILTGSLAAGLIVTLALAGLAFWQRNLAVEQQRIATEQRDGALRSGSRLLANLAREQTKQGDAAAGMRLALEALPDKAAGAERPYVPEAKLALDESWRAARVVRVLEGHRHWVVSVAFSPDGTRIVTGSPDKTARLWDAASGAELATFRLPNELTHVAFSPDSSRVLTIDDDNEATLWDTVHSSEIITLSEGGIQSASFNPDGTRLITDSKDGRVRIWELPTGKRLVVLGGRGGPLRSAGFSPDGRYVLTVSADKTARLWDPKNGAQITVFTGHQGPVTDAVFSPDGALVVTVSTDKTARVWNAASGAQVTLLSGHQGAVLSAVFSPDGRLILTGSEDTTARLWDAVSGKQLAEFTGHGNRLNGAKFSPDGAFAITWASHEKSARLWDIADRKLRGILSAHGDKLDGAVFSPDSKRVVTAADDWNAIVWDIASGREVILAGGMLAGGNVAVSPGGSRVLMTLEDQTARLWDAGGKQLAILADVRDAGEFSPDGTRILMMAASKNVARLWDATTGKELAVLPAVTAIFNPGGTRILTTSEREARLWDAATGDQAAVLAGHEADVTSAQFSPDGRRVLTASEDKTARLWDATSGKQVATLAGHESSVAQAIFSPDGARIVTTGVTDASAYLWDGTTGQQIALLPGDSSGLSAWFSPDSAHVVTVRNTADPSLWDAASGRQVAVLAGHEGVVSLVTFSPDGKRVLTASEDNTVRLWNAATGEPLAVLSGGPPYVTRAVFSPDGTRLVTHSAGEGPGLLWDVPTGRQLADLSRVTDASFSPDGRHFLTIERGGMAFVRESAGGEAVAMLGDSVAGSATYDRNDRVIASTFVPGEIGGAVRMWRLFPDTQALIDQAKAAIPLCLRPAQRRQLFLDPEPPRWCITGVGRERESDPTRWTGLFPYDGPEWKDWLAAKDRGEVQPLPQLAN